MEYTLDDVFMAGFEDGFEKTAEAGDEEIDLSGMPVFAKAAANLGLVEAPEQALDLSAMPVFAKAAAALGLVEEPAEDLSDLEKLAFSMKGLREKAGKVVGKARAGASKALDRFPGVKDIKEGRRLTSFAKATEKSPVGKSQKVQVEATKKEGKSATRKGALKAVAGGGALAVGGAAALRSLLKKKKKDKK